MTRKKVTIFGAGLVSGPVIDTLLNMEYDVRVVDQNASAVAVVQAKYARHPNSSNLEVLRQDARDDSSLASKITDSDLVVSLLPAAMHIPLAKLCVDLGRNMLTASYVSDEMRALDSQARQKGLVLLNECGLDPGIDHMSAMELFDDVHARGGKVVSFKSYCGGLPLNPRNNPLSYQLSWSPRGVFAAAKSGALFLQDRKVREISAGELFKNFERLDVPRASGNGNWGMEMYYNRDSRDYSGGYGLEGEVETFVRGTLRYPGWCETLQAMVDLGYLDVGRQVAGKTYAEVFSDAPIQDTDFDISAAIRVTEKLGKRPNVEAIVRRLEWLGCFDTREIVPSVGQGIVNPDEEGTPFAALVDLANRSMRYRDGQTDLVLLYHDVTSRFVDGRTERSQLVLERVGNAYSDSYGNSAMAQTVGLPVAFAAELILEGRISQRGVVIPTSREIYQPVLRKLDEVGIRFVNF